MKIKYVEVTWNLITKLGRVLEQGPTLHRPMPHPVVFKYLSYSTTLSEHAAYRRRRCTAFGRAGTSRLGKKTFFWEYRFGGGKTRKLRQILHGDKTA